MDDDLEQPASQRAPDSTGAGDFTSEEREELFADSENVVVCWTAAYQRMCDIWIFDDDAPEDGA